MKKEEAKTKTKALVVFGVFLLSVFSVAAVAGQASQPAPEEDFYVVSGSHIGYVAGQASQPAPEEVSEQSEEEQQADYKILQISPKHEWFELKPGGEKEFTVKVKNKDEETVSTSPRIEVQPFGEYFLEEDWITVEPGSADINAGGEQEYTVTVKIPEDAEIGHYSAQIVFTNDTMPTPYPAPFPMYVNSLSLSIQVWEPPKITIQPQHIHDRVEAGQSHEYKIQLENKGDKAIAISPEIDGERSRSHCIGPGCPSEIPADWISIEAPSTVEAKSKATVKVKVKVPADAKGMYDGSINLNIDDPSIERWDQEVHVHIEVWKQPTTPFREGFAVKQGEKFSVVVTARQHAYDRYGGGVEEKEEPSFDVTLTTPEGGKPTSEPSKTVKKGEISLGMDYLPPWEASSEGMYHAMSTEYSETYGITNATGGAWTLEILPRNAERFEYTIEIGE